MTSDLRRNIEKKPILRSKDRLLHPSQGNPRQSEVLTVEKKKLARPLVDTTTEGLSSGFGIGTGLSGYYYRGRVISLSLRIGLGIGC